VAHAYLVMFLPGSNDLAMHQGRTTSTNGHKVCAKQRVFKKKMFSSLPADICREITLQAIRQRNEDVRDEIKTTIARALECAVIESCAFVKMSLFPGSSKYLNIAEFSDFKIGSMRSTTMEFWVDDQEFFVTKNTYYCDGDFDEESDYSLFVHNKTGKYSDIVSETFKHLFPKSIVY